MTRLPSCSYAILSSLALIIASAFARSSGDILSNFSYLCFSSLRLRFSAILSSVALGIYFFSYCLSSVTGGFFWPNISFLKVSMFLSLLARLGCLRSYSAFSAALLASKSASFFYLWFFSSMNSWAFAALSSNGNALIISCYLLSRCSSSRSFLSFYYCSSVLASFFFFYDS